MRITKRQLRKIIRETIHSSVNPILDEYELQDFDDWIEDGNAYEIEDGIWVEQTTQYRRKFTLEQLQMFFKQEFMQ